MAEHAAALGTKRLSGVNMTTADLVGVAATAWGLGGAVAVLLQARRMLQRRSSCDVSAGFFAVYVVGYAIWLLYGFAIASMPIIVVHAVGLVFGSITLVVTLALRGSVLRPAVWGTCPAT